MKKIYVLFVIVMVISVFCVACGSARNEDVGISGDGEIQGNLEEFPEKTIKIITPYSSGGVVDQTTRMMADALSEVLQQSVIVENMPGASGELGWSEAYYSEPDGYTLAIVSNSMAIVAADESVSYDYTKFEYLMGACDYPYLVVVPASSDIYTIDDLIEYAGENTLLYTAGLASGIGFYSGVDLINQTGIANSRFHYVPFDGITEALIAIAAGDCTAGAASASSTVINMIKNGEIRAICVMSEERLNDLPDVPTTVELGYPELIYTTVLGFAAPPETPEEICEFLVDAMAQAAELESYRETEKNIGVSRRILSGEELKEVYENAYSNSKRLIDIENSWER